MLLIAIAAGAGCADQVPTLYATTTALVGTDLAPPDDGVPATFGHYRWELLGAPSDESVGDLSVETAAITVTPPKRGIYAFDRWFVGQVADQLSYHVVMTVDGAAPSALIAGPTMAAIAAPTTLDGSGSSSPEHLALTFQWRLAFRPAASTLDLADATSPTLMLVLDVAGDYGVELRVFDGELWSQPAMITLVAR